MIFRSHLLPLLSLVGIVFAGWTVVQGRVPIPVALPISAPPTPPSSPAFRDIVAGSGIVEAASENVAIGAPSSGLVQSVSVRIGEQVPAGAVLFNLDDRVQKAALAVAQGVLEQAQAQYRHLIAMPRPEDLPPARARLALSEATLADMKDRLGLLESVTDPRAVSRDELDRSRSAVAVARTQVEQSRAELAELVAGAWKADISVAKAAVQAAQAEADASRTAVALLTVRAPFTGTVLQLNIHTGEYAQAGTLATPLILFGDTSHLRVRVQVDEDDAWRIRPGAAARASLRGNSSLKVPLVFDHLEPYVVPKLNLTGDSTERVDTRVLEIIYRIGQVGFTLYPGQQFDVFIAANIPDGVMVPAPGPAKPPSGATRSPP